MTRPRERRYDIYRSLSTKTINVSTINRYKRISIGHVYEYSAVHYFENPRHTQSMIAYMILTEIPDFSENVRSGNVINLLTRPISFRSAKIQCMIPILDIIA